MEFETGVAVEVWLRKKPYREFEGDLLALGLGKGMWILGLFFLRDRGIGGLMESLPVI